jgi:hypothetical protein
MHNEKPKPFKIIEVDLNVEAVLNIMDEGWEFAGTRLMGISGTVAQKRGTDRGP